MALARGSRATMSAIDREILRKEEVMNSATGCCDAGQVIQADCLEWLARQPDDSFGLVFGSPPYAMKGDRYIGHR